MNDHDDDDVTPPFHGQLVPAQPVSRMQSTAYTRNSIAATSMRGVSAICYRWGLGHIAKAIDAHTAVEVAMTKLHAAQLSRAKAEGTET